jgi:hypothetical protein
MTTTPAGTKSKPKVKRYRVKKLLHSDVFKHTHFRWRGHAGHRAICSFCGSQGRGFEIELAVREADFQMAASYIICQRAYDTILTEDPVRLQHELNFQRILPGTEC